MTYKFPTPQEIDVEVDKIFAEPAERWCRTIAQDLSEGKEGSPILFTDNVNIQRLVKATIEAEGHWLVTISPDFHGEPCITVRRK